MTQCGFLQTLFYVQYIIITDIFETMEYRRSGLNSQMAEVNRFLRAHGHLLVEPLRNGFLRAHDHFLVEPLSNEFLSAHGQLLVEPRP